jgi:para-nitrobenzyl esterase
MGRLCCALTIEIVSVTPTMKRRLFRLAMLLLILVPLALGVRWWTSDPRPGPERADPATERQITQGRLIGFDAGSGAHGWLGIPYAAPPVDDLRWRAPRPALSWGGLREALVAGPPCPQLGGPLSDVPLSDYGDVIGEEDCLTLNVWAPAKAAGDEAGQDTPYPVMVWIHGGGNTIGYGADYDGRFLAATENVVVVTINYRLGVLGWFNHPAILESAATPEDASGNFGTLDTIAALVWVRDNIASFGGDPERVTVFGESAGGVNVFGLMASPLAEGLFHRAISQSGLARASTVHSARAFRSEGGHPASAGEVVSRWLVEQGRAPERVAADEMQRAMSADQLRAFLADLDAADMIGGFSAPGGMYRAPALLLDGHVLPERSLLETLADRDAGSTVPLIAGSNRDEARLFMALDDRWVERRLGVLLRIRDPATHEAVAGILSDHWRLLGVDQPLDALSAANPDIVYGYRFDWDEGGTAAIADLPSLLGAAHGFELPFVFGDFDDLWGIPLLFTDENEPGRRALSRDIMAYWGAFARSGSPTGNAEKALPEWPTWSDEHGSAGSNSSSVERSGRVLVLDTDAGGGIRPLDQRVDLDDLHARFLAVAPGVDERLACGLYAYLFWETSAWDGERYRSLGAICTELDPAALAPDPFRK